MTATLSATMATLPVISGIQRVAFGWAITGGGPSAVNVMHFSTASTDTLALKDLIDASVSAAMWTHTMGTVGIFQLAITPLDGTSATQIYPVSGAKWSGTGAVADYSPATAVIVSLRTTQRGRQNRGRVFLPFPTEANIANGSVGATRTTMQTAWDAFRTAMATGLMPMHVASYGHGLHKHKNPDGSITYTPVTWTAHSNAVTTTTVESLLGTMRPRQGRLR